MYIFTLEYVHIRDHKSGKDSIGHENARCAIELSSGQNPERV